MPTGACASRQRWCDRRRLCTPPTDCWNQAFQSLRCASTLVTRPTGGGSRSKFRRSERSQRTCPIRGVPPKSVSGKLVAINIAIPRDKAQGSGNKFYRPRSLQPQYRTRSSTSAAISPVPKRRNALRVRYRFNQAATERTQKSGSAFVIDDRTYYGCGYASLRRWYFLGRGAEGARVGTVLCWLRVEYYRLRNRFRRGEGLAMSDYNGPVGFICKQCSGPSPIGVGYTGDRTEAAYRASRDRKTCDCGYSQTPENGPHPCTPEENQDLKGKSRGIQ